MTDRAFLAYSSVEGWLYAFFNVYLYHLLCLLNTMSIDYFSPSFFICYWSWLTIRSLLLVSVGYYHFEECVLLGSSHLFLYFLLNWDYFCTTKFSSFDVLSPFIFYEFVFTSSPHSVPSGTKCFTISEESFITFFIFLFWVSAIWLHFCSPSVLEVLPQF